MSHDHNFISWPFNTAINTASFVTRQVIEREQPILEIYHDHDGEWQFLCGTTLDSKDLKVACLGCMAEQFPVILEFANMSAGCCAIFNNSTNKWTVEAYEDIEDDNE